MNICINKNLIYGYIFLPIIIFSVGWLRLPIAVCIVASTLISLWRINSKSTEDNIYFKKSDIVSIVLVVFVCALAVYFSGIGGFSFQNNDHRWRNEIFNLLVEEKWPVVQLVNMEGGQESRGLVYYIGFWLPAAVIGKIFGLSIGYLFQMFWAILGLFLTCSLLFEYFEKVSVKIVFGFLFFSGLDIIGCFLLGMDIKQIYPFMHLEWWSGFQFSSFITQLFWVFNQAIYAWVIFLMIMRQKTNRHIILIWSTGLLTCTLPFVGMLPFLIFKIVSNFKYKLQIKPRKLVNMLKASELFTIENIFGGGCIGLLSFVYEISNISATNSGSHMNYSKGYLFLYIVFMLLEVGVYAFTIYKYQYSNPLFWLCIIVLMLCPWIRVGSGMDFCMRASIPALLILYVLVVDTWKEAKNKKDYVIIISISIIYLLGAVTPFNELWRTTKNTTQLYYDGQYIMAEAVPSEDIMGASNFSGDISKSLFFKYLAKR